jgi:CRP-like cAMP-binding protein
MSSTTSSVLTAQTLEGNRILALLTPEARQHMLPALTLVNLDMSSPLYEQHELSTPLYFPLTAITSVFSEMGATVGREGMVGLSVFLGDETTVRGCFTQMSGTALSMGLEDFHGMVEDQESGLQSILLRYTQALFGQLAQQSACDRSHTMEQRCARWILMTQDRVGHDEFPLTQKFLAYMLGARRASVTIAANILARTGLIRYTSEKIQVLDRGRLEEASCECHGVIRREYERLIPIKENVESLKRCWAMFF